MKNTLSNIYMTFVWVVVLVTGIFHFYTRYQSTSHEITYNYKKSTALYQPQMKTKGRGPASVDGPLASCDPIDRGLNMTIGPNQISYLRNSINVDVLTIEGQLHCDQIRAASTIEIKARTILIKGTFQCGTAANPYSKKLIISLKDSGVDPRTYHGHRGIIVEPGGKLILNGERSKAGWYKLAQTVMPGDQSLFVDFANMTEASSTRNSSNERGVAPSPTPPGQSPVPRPFRWKAGDKIVLGPTGFNYQEAESFTILGVNPLTQEIYLDHPAQFRHWGETQNIDSRVLGTFTLDERAEVANLTRSILIRADESEGFINEGTAPGAQVGGHIMVHDQGQAYIDSVELFKMGQAGVMARYPFHWHWVGDASGQYIKNSSIHHSYQRCVTVHRTQNALVQNNVCYDFKGHGYFLEDGNETGNQILHNLAIKANPPSANKLLLHSDNVAQSEGQGRFPAVSGFWISNPKNIVKYNVVSGSVGTGFWMSFEREIKDPAGNIIARPIKEVTTEFSYNTAHATKVGITWDGAPTGALTNNPNNPNDRRVESAHYEPPTTPTFVGLKAFKNYLTGIYFRGNTVIYKNNIVADNGWSYWTAYNQIIKDSVFIGKTDNSSAEIDHDYYHKSDDNGRARKAGIVIYDGPFEIHHSDFIDYPTAHETFTTDDGVTFNSTPTPIITTGGTNKFTNLVSDLHFSPNPIYRIHTEGPEDTLRAIQGMGNSVVRDLDGSLSGTNSPSVVTGIRSLGVTPQSGCTEQQGLHNFLACPSSYKEGSLTFMRWGGGGSPWGTPFVVKRSDGVYTYKKSEWSVFPFHPNNLFATNNTQTYSYELLPYYQYEYDRIVNTHTAMDANSEDMGPNAPVVKIIAYGKNCKLDQGAVQAANLQSLKRMTVTSYYSNGEDFYVRLIPRTAWEPITGGAASQATAYTTMPIRHRITCDTGYLPLSMKGKITGVRRDNTTTYVSGWACEYTKANPVKVQLYAYGPSIPQRGVANANIAIPNVYTLIKQVNSTDPSSEQISFDCGKLSPAGKGFTFAIPTTELLRFSKHKFYVKTLATVNGTPEKYLDGSGNYPVLPIVVSPGTPLPAPMQNQ